MKKILNIVYWVIIIAVVLVAVAFVSQDKINSTDYSVYSVNSGSMEPAIPLGSLIFINSAENYQEGDIITFRNNNSKDTTTHRIVGIERDDDIDKLLYTTKGDANEDPDSSQTDHSQVVGKVRFHVPYLGYPVGFAKTQTGFILLIVVPATIIIYSELSTIKDETKKIIKGRKKSGEDKPEKPKKSKSTKGNETK